MKPCVLLFGLSPMEGMLVKNTLALQGIPVKMPDQTRYGQPIGSLAGGQLPVLPGRAAGKTALAEPVMVLCHLSEGEMDGVLAALQKAGLCRGVLKAVLTPVNQYWNAPMLAEELRRERAAMERQRKT